MLNVGRTNQLGSILEAREPPGIVKQAFEAVVIDVVLQFRKQSPNEIADEDHFGFKGTED